jgi:hypothetical protein
VSTKFKVGDKVVNKQDHSEYGEVCAVSVSGRSVRVMMQHPFGKLWWFDINELEYYE